MSIDRAYPPPYIVGEEAVEGVHDGGEDGEVGGLDGAHEWRSQRVPALVARHEKRRPGQRQRGNKNKGSKEHSVPNVVVVVFSVLTRCDYCEASREIDLTKLSNEWFEIVDSFDQIRFF